MPALSNKMPRGLHTRFSLAFLCIVISVVIVLSSVSIIQFRAGARLIVDKTLDSTGSVLTEQALERGRRMATTLTEALIIPLSLRDQPGIRQVLDASLTQQEIQTVQVFSTAGELLAQGGTSPVSSSGHSAFADISVALQTLTIISSTYPDQLAVSAPILMGDLALGTVHLVLSRSDHHQTLHDNALQTDAAMRNALLNVITTVLITALLASLAGTIFGYRVTRVLLTPLQGLLNQAKDIIRGSNPDSTVPERQDEFGQLDTAFRIISERIREHGVAMQKLADYDRLTGLPNRAFFSDRLGAVVEHHLPHQSCTGALMFIDLDHFKKINEAMGHQAGDDLLCQVAERLQSALRNATGDIADSAGSRSNSGSNSRSNSGSNFGSETTEQEINGQSATVSRLGGDEFIVLVPDIDSEFTAAEIAQSFLNSLSEPVLIKGQTVSLGASIGICIIGENSRCPDELLRNADLALNHAKSQGRNQYQFFRPGMSESLRSGMELEAELRRALELDQLCVYYQPQYSGIDGSLSGFEALIRWQHPEKGMVSPGDFIPIAEETGLIVPIGNWVLHRACTDLKHWHERFGSHLHVAVNVSAVQLARHDFISEVKQALADARLASQALHLEITESCLMAGILDAKAAMLAMDQLGVEVWMDDFGTGYSSLSNLRKFPFKGVKIDYSFVHKMTEEPEDRAIVRAIVAMADNLGIQVTAEGVEDAEQQKLLMDMHCDRMQGFHLGRPMPASDIVPLLNRACDSGNISNRNPVRKAG